MSYRSHSSIARCWLIFGATWSEREDAPLKIEDRTGRLHVRLHGWRLPKVRTFRWSRVVRTHWLSPPPVRMSRQAAIVTVTTAATNQNGGFLLVVGVSL